MTKSFNLSNIFPFFLSKKASKILNIWLKNIIKVKIPKKIRAYILFLINKLPRAPKSAKQVISNIFSAIILPNTIVFETSFLIKTILKKSPTLEGKNIFIGQAAIMARKQFIVGMSSPTAFNTQCHLKEENMEKLKVIRNAAIANFILSNLNVEITSSNPIAFTKIDIIITARERLKKKKD